MKQLKEKTKDFIEQNKKEITDGILVGLISGSMMFFGYRLGWKKHGNLIDKGLMKAVSDGFIILTKPSGDATITKLTIEEWNKAIQEYLGS